MKKSVEPQGVNDSVDLEFPDWSGMKDSPLRMSPEEAMRLTFEYRNWFPEAALLWDAHRPTPVDAEFVL